MDEGDANKTNDETSSCKSHRSSYTTVSRASTRSVRAASTRLRQLEEQQRLEAAAEESRRQLELARARHALELAEIDEQEKEEMEERARSLRHSSQDVALCDLTNAIESQPENDRRRTSNQLEPAGSHRPEPDSLQSEPVSHRPEPVSHRPGPGSHRPEPVSHRSDPILIVRESPKLDILPFDGKYSRYPFFKLQVDEAMRSGQFTDLQIIRHLRDRLKGPAFEAVHGALLSGCPLLRIMHALESRFGNRLQVTSAVTTQLLNFDTILSNDTELLSQFGTAVYNAISTLQAVGFESELDNLRTLQLLTGKLPLESQQAWGAYARRRCEDGRKLSCGLFHEFLEEHIKDRQYGVIGSSLQVHPSHDVKNRSGSRGRTSRRDRHEHQRERHGYHGAGRTSRPPAEPPTSVYAANGSTQGTQEATARRPVACFYCGQNHYIARCEQFQRLTPNDRLSWVNTKKACVRCLNTSHQSSDCHRTGPCGLENCRQHHHRLLHLAQGSTTVINAAKDGHTSILMKTVVIEVSGSTKRRCVAFLDEGSSVTLMTDKLAQELGLHGKRQNLRIKTMSGLTSVNSCELTQVTIENIHTGSKHLLDRVATVPELQIDKNPVTGKQLKRMFFEIEEIGIKQLDEPPQMLIGLDHAELIATRKIIKTSKNGPLLQETKLGWTITGRVIATEDTESECVNFLNKSLNMYRDDSAGSAAYSTDSDCSDICTVGSAGDLSNIWRTEHFGCKYAFSKPLSPDDRKAETTLQEGAKHDGTRWTAPLLLKNEDEKMPESRTMAEQRAIALEKRLDRSQQKKNGKTPSLAELVYEKMEKMISDGHFRKLSENEAQEEHKNVWYLPLLAVQNQKKPNKVRLVLDAAAKSNGKSLNDFLLQGPDHMNSIPGILCRWREKRVAVTSDVIAMFSQIKVREEDRPILRFLWRGSRRTGRFDVYESPVVIFGATCSPSIAEHCFRRTADEFTEDEAVKTAVREDTYVDDIVTGTDTEQEAVKLIDSVTETLKKGGFKLGPWASNSEEVLHTVQQEQEQQDSRLQRTLGVGWEARLDTLTYEPIAPPEQLTKRTLLSTMMSVYDPIGFLTGFLLRAKKLLQVLWKSSVKWDQELPSEVQQKVKMWMDELTQTRDLHIPRHIFRQEAGISSVDLHAFCDASEMGFCAVLYYRWIDWTGCIQVSFISAHSRVAPVKKMSIPRLELQAAVLASRMIAFIRKETRTGIKSTTCWSDSKNVLAWLRSTNRRYSVFVANRIAEIHDVTGPADWRYVPTAMNAADSGSRGHKIEDLCPDKEWIRGPEFLYKPETDWPDDCSDATGTLETDMESKPVVLATTVKIEPNFRESTPDLSRFSRWTVAVRTVARIRRWLKIVRERKCGPLTADELREAEEIWTRRVQGDSYRDELLCLQQGHPIKNKSQLSGMTVGLLDGIICLDSRVKRSPALSPTARNPPVLARDHKYTELLIEHLHQKMGHRAHDAVLVSLRQKCWVPQAARKIRSVVARCQTCRVRKGKPQTTRMAPLPLARVTMLEGAFRATGMDYFGPMKVKRGKTVTKIWGVLFRCLATRAVHIELTDSLDTDAALMVISRFQARRGNVQELWSDNGKNLTSANKALNKQLRALNQDKMMAKLSLEGIKWRFIPPSDPEAGGAWERAIRTVKDTLKMVLKEQTPRFEVLQTVMTEVEKIINSTPLFHVPVDAADDDVLTPFHFLIGRATPAYPVGAQVQGSECLRRRWKHAQVLADHFWRRWAREYLPTLANRSKWIQSSRNVAEGDVVIVADPQHPRGLWVRGVVTDTVRGPDGVVRSARVRTVHGVLHRPVRKLVVLQVLRCT